MIAMIYPGQGSQFPGMGKFLYDEFAIARRTFEESSDAISFDLKKLCFDGAEADLALTHNTQPALLTVSVATYRVLAELTALKPMAAAGHSVGEYAAVVNGGALNLSDATRAVRRRGEAMQSAVPVGQGAMAAVLGLSDEQVIDLCRWVNETSQQGPLEPANFNCPGQVVISGRSSAVTWAQENFSAEAFKGAPARLKMIPIKVSAPFHCSMMAPAEKTMREFFGGIKFKDSAYPIVQNVSAEPISAGSALCENLIRQVTAPVRWVECVNRLKDLGARQLIETGCGKVLAGLVKKIDSESLNTLNINSLDELKAIETTLSSSAN